MEQEKPIYLFMGLLESGKTSVIKDFLANNQFAQSECNLVILTEEGEEELEESLLQESNSKVIVIEDQADFTAEKLRELDAKYKPSSILIEVNGMWNMQEFMEIELPTSWFVFQIIGLVNAETSEVYQKNMKDKFVDLYRYAELIIYNRCTTTTRQQDIRRNIRVVNTRAQVVFESEDPNFIEEPPELPYSIDDDPIVVELDDYGAFFVDLQDNPLNYDKKRVKFAGYICSAKKDGKIHYAVGRVGMACCADDMMFLGIPAEGKEMKKLNAAKSEREWGEITASIKIGMDKEGNVESLLAKVEGFQKTPAPEDPIVYFN